MPTTIPYTTTVVTPTGGLNGNTGSGMDYQFTLSLTGSSGGLVTITLTDQLTGFQTQLGAGNVTALLPSYIYTFNNKVYALAASTAYFTAVDAPETWNDPNGAGNGFITMTNYYSSNVSLSAMAPYQGRVLFISSNVVQVWAVDPDPANYAVQQTLANIGTIAPLSVQPIGDMDVYMLYSSGIRSVRVRDASNNALIADIGTPIDSIITAQLALLTPTQQAAACAACDPSANRYWLYMPTPSGAAGYIYAFSYFPSSQVAAFGTYYPSYQSAVAAPAANYTAGAVTYTGLSIGARYAWLPGANEVSLTCGTTTLARSTSLSGEGAFTATATTAIVTGTSATATFTGALSQTIPFVPTKFVVYNSQVWARAGNLMLQYGGTNNASYDNCGVSATTPYLSSETPGTRKFFSAIDAALEGNWTVGFGSDYNSGAYRPVYNNTLSSFKEGRIQVNQHATHCSLQLTENSNAYARFSSALIYFDEEDQKKQP